MALRNNKKPFDPKDSTKWREICLKSRITISTSHSLGSWQNTALRQAEKGDFAFLKKDYESAYIHYTKSLTMLLEIIPTTPDYKTLAKQKDPIIGEIKKRGAKILGKAEESKLLVLKMIKEEHEATLKAGNNKALGPRDSSKLKIGSSASSKKEDARYKDSSTPSNSDPYNSTRDQKKSTASSTQSALKDSGAYSNPNGTFTSGKIFELPKENYISPGSLLNIINRSNLSGTPTLLFLDVRPPYMFKAERMNVTHVVNIDPLILRKHVSSVEIEKKLELDQSDPFKLFYHRHRFDGVIIFDENSVRVLAPVMNNEEATTGMYLHYLVKAISEYEPDKKLKRQPILMVGGIKAWKQQIGTSGMRGDLPSSVLIPPSKKAEHHDLRRNAIGPARSRPIIKNLQEFFQQNPNAEIKDKQSMQFPLTPTSPIAATHIHSPQNHVDVFSPVSLKSNLEGSSESFQSFTSSIGTGKTSRQKTMFDDPLYGFTPTKKELQGFVEEKPPASLNSIYQPPSDPSSVYQHPVSVPIKSPPPIPPKPSSLQKARPQTPPLVSSLSYAMNIGTTGLKNLGNTCYMNSIIQCINGTIPLSRYFLDGSFKRHINRENPLGSGGILVDAFEELVRILWTEGASYISPTKFKAAVGKVSYQFKGNEQQDSQEFLAFILDGLHEDLNLVKQRPPPDADDDDDLERLSDKEASNIAWEKYLHRNNSIIVSLFQGQLKSRLECNICHKSSTTFNTFMYLSLPIPKSKGTPITLLECLDLFIQEETLDGDNSWMCPRCKKPQPSTKKLSISRLPDVLLIHLKRFSYDGPFRDKLDTPINFPLRRLDLQGYVPFHAPKSSILSPKGTPIGNSYDLYAVSNHYGSLTGGHYTASVRNGYGGKWHYFDDSRVTTIHEKEAVTKAAYNLFYVRTNSDTAHL